MSLDELQLVGSDVFFQGDGLVLRQRSKTADTRFHFIGIEVQALGNEVGVGSQVAGRIPQQQRGKRWVVVHDSTPFAVENLAARREHGYVANAIFLCRKRIV